MISEAPRSFAPSVAHSPIGPCAKTATASPTLTSPLSAPERPVEEMSGQHQHLLVGEPVRNRRQVGARVGHEQVLGPGAVDGVAEAPAAERAMALRVHAVQAVEALAARRDGADDDALADRVVLVEAAPELLDDADRLVAEDQPGLHRVLALDDVHVGAADGRGRDADDRLASLRSGTGNILHSQVTDPMKYNRLHLLHGTSSDPPRRRLTAYCMRP